MRVPPATQLADADDPIAPRSEVRSPSLHCMAWPCLAMPCDANARRRAASHWLSMHCTTQRGFGRPERRLWLSRLQPSSRAARLNDFPSTRFCGSAVLSCLDRHLGTVKQQPVEPNSTSASLHTRAPRSRVSLVRLPRRPFALRKSPLWRGDQHRQAAAANVNSVPPLPPLNAISARIHNLAPPHSGAQ